MSSYYLTTYDLDSQQFSSHQCKVIFGADYLYSTILHAQIMLDSMATLFDSIQRLEETIARWKNVTLTDISELLVNTAIGGTVPMQSGDEKNDESLDRWVIMKNPYSNAELDRLAVEAKEHNTTIGDYMEASGMGRVSENGILLAKYLTANESFTNDEYFMNKEEVSQ